MALISAKVTPARTCTKPIAAASMDAFKAPRAAPKVRAFSFRF